MSLQQNPFHEDDNESLLPIDPAEDTVPPLADGMLARRDNLSPHANRPQSPSTFQANISVGGDDTMVISPNSSRHSRPSDTVPLQYIIGDLEPHHILFGQGHRTNVHEGNQRYFHLILFHQPDYLKAKEANNVAEKKAIIKIVLQRLQEVGMQFVDFDIALQHWYVVDINDKRVYIRVSNALREDHSADGRKKKRDRYQAAQKKKKPAKK